MISILKTKEKGHPFEDLYIATDYIAVVRRVRDEVTIRMIDGKEYLVRASLPEVMQAMNERFM